MRDYETLRELGSGGAATVELARHRELGRHVAIKRVHVREDAARGRLLREARVLARLAHPHIVVVHDCLEEDGEPVIVMEYLSGGSLRPQVGRVSPAQAGGVLRSVLAALAYAHERGVVHRDLKPENVLLSADGLPKIADFGIAKVLDALLTDDVRTATGIAVGTPAYMSPEQALAAPVGPASDLYSCGVVAYELLTGTLPFEAATAAAVLLQHVNEPAPSARRRDPSLLPALDAWLLRLLSKEPYERYESAQAAWEALDAALTEQCGSGWEKAAELHAAPGLATTLSAPEAEAPANEDSGPRLTRRRLVALAGAAVATGASGLVFRRLAGASQPASGGPDGIRNIAAGYVGYTPGAIAAEWGRLWVASYAGERVLAVDPALGPDAPPSVELDGAPTAIATGLDAAWVLLGGQPRLVRVEVGERGPRISSRFPLDAPATGLATGRDAVWLIGDEARVVRIEPNRRRREVALPAVPTALCAVPDAIWIADRAGQLVRIDPADQRIVAVHEIGMRPSALAADEGVVWVGDRAGGAVIRVDADDGRRLGTVRQLPGKLTAIAAGDGAVWLAATHRDDRGTILKVDAATGRVRGRASVPSAAGVAALGTTAWVTDWIGGRVVALR